VRQPGLGEAVPVQLFSGRNARATAIAASFPDDVHAAIVEFANADEDGASDERFVFNDGFTAENAELFERVKLDYACSPTGRTPRGPRLARTPAAADRDA
jgi:hypothetical protein